MTAGTDVDLAPVRQAYERYVTPLLDMAREEISAVRPKFSVERSFIWRGAQFEDYMLTARLTVFAGEQQDSFIVHLALLGARSDGLLSMYGSLLAQELSQILIDANVAVGKTSKPDDWPNEGIYITVKEASVP